MSIRLKGKAGFAHLQQGGKRLQIYVKNDAVGEKGFELYKLLDLGDHIGVKGYLFRTRTGELTVHVEEITFLVKDLLPLPEKWHGLQDVETALPPPLRGPDDESRGARGLHQARQGRAVHAPLSRRHAASSRSRRR